MNVDKIFNSLQTYPYENISFTSEERNLISNLIKMPLGELFNLCNQEYDKYMNLRIQITKLFIYDNIYKNYDNALSAINNLLQLVVMNDEFNKFAYELYYLKTTLFIHHDMKEKANDFAQIIYNEYYRGQSVKVKGSIHKLLAMTSEDLEKAIWHLEKANQLSEYIDQSEKGFINKNLSFLYLDKMDLKCSLVHLLKFFITSSLVDLYSTDNFLIISSYLEIVVNKYILSEEQFERLKKYLESLTSLTSDQMIDKELLLNELDKTYNEIMKG